MCKNKFILFVYSLTPESGIKILIQIYFRSYEFLPTPELKLFELKYSLTSESGIL